MARKDLTYAQVLRALLKHGATITPENPTARYFGEVESALARVKRSPTRVKLSNQEAYTLSAAWRRFTRSDPKKPGAHVPYFPFNSRDEISVRRWYQRQSNIASRELPTKYRKLVQEFRKLQRKHAGYEEASRYKLAFKPHDTATDPYRRFHNIDSLERFLALPHYKEARDRIKGRFAIIKLDKTGKPHETVMSIR